MLIDYFKKVFSLDYRALAFLRVGVGLLVLVDLIRRSFDFVAHYTDQGIFHPLQADLASYYLLPSIFLLNQSIWWQGLLFFITGLLAILLIVGYKTKYVAIGLWYLVLSLQLANPYIINRGDHELLFLLFWGMFLPWQSLRTIDSGNSKPNQKTIFSAATVAYTLQISYIYFFAFFHKCQSAVWCSDFTAVHYAFSLDSYTTDLAVYLLNFPHLLAIGTFLIVSIQFFTLPLLLTPSKKDWVRTVIVTVLIGTHVAYIATLHIGLFAYISIVGLIALYPSSVWDWIGNLLYPKKELTIYYDKKCTFCFKSVQLIKTFLLHQGTQIKPAQSSEIIFAAMQKHDSWVVTNNNGEQFFTFQAGVEIIKHSPLRFIFVPLAKLPGMNTIGERVYRLIAKNRSHIALPAVHSPKTKKTYSDDFKIVRTAIVTASLFFITIGNLQSLSIITFDAMQQRVWNNIRFNQNWGVFAPVPDPNDGWYILRGETADGTAINIKSANTTISDQRPEDISDTYKNQRWRKFSGYLFYDESNTLRQLYLEWHCRKNQELNTVELLFALEFTTPTSSLPIAFKTLQGITCERDN